MKKLILLLSILLFIYSCGAKSFPDMSKNNPVQVYSEDIVKNGKIDNNTIKTLLASSGNIEELLKTLYNDNVIIKSYYDDWILIGIPKYSNTDFYQILKDYCAVKTNDNYYTILTDYTGKILTKGFCYSGKVQLKESRHYYASGEKSKKLLYITEDINKLIKKYGIRSGNTTSKSFFGNNYETFLITNNQDYNFYSIQSSADYRNEKRLVEEYKLQLDKQYTDINTIKYLDGKSSTMDITINFEDQNNIPEKIIFTVRTKKGFTRKIDDFIGVLYINNKPYHYIYTYTHYDTNCPYNQNSKSFLLLPNGECSFEIDIEEIQNLPEQIDKITNLKYVSKYGTVKLNKTTIWDKAYSDKNKIRSDKYDEYMPMTKKMELLYK